jgi:hypothetical protein
MSTPRTIGPLATAAALALISTLGPPASRPARADFQLITNGGFEVGFTGWNRQDQVGSEGTFALQSGTTSPVNGTTVPAPPGGSSAAMTDAQGPGSHVLYQNFVVPTGQTGGTLSFQLFVGNRASAFFTPNPNTLDFSTPALNQQARVDIIRAGSDPFTVAPADVLLNAFQTKPGDPLVSGYTTVTVNVSSLIQSQGGQTLSLRFAETDNVFAFQLGVDNVSLLAVPEPSSLVLYVAGAGLSAGCTLVRRRARARGRTVA